MSLGSGLQLIQFLWDVGSDTLHILIGGAVSFFCVFGVFQNLTSVLRWEGFDDLLLFLGQTIGDRDEDFGVGLCVVIKGIFMMPEHHFELNSILLIVLISFFALLT